MKCLRCGFVGDYGGANHSAVVCAASSAYDTSLASLSPNEKDILSKMNEVPYQLDEFFTLALRLLAGRSLVSFAPAFVTMGVSFALDSGIHSAHRAFLHLTTFNRISHSDTKSAFLEAIAPLRLDSNSPISQRTVIRMLFACGDEATALEANNLSKDLRKDKHPHLLPDAGKWRQIKTAGPETVRPIDMDESAQYFEKIESSKLLQSFNTGIEDRRFGDFLPVACRFEPLIAREKTKRILEELCTRTGVPFRQIVFCFGDHIPLIEPNLARQLVSRIEEGDIISTLDEQDQSVCRRLIFDYIAAQLTAEEQLEIMTRGTLGSTFHLSVLPSLKPQPTESIVRALEKALNSGDESAVFGAIVAGTHGETRISTELECLILKCSELTPSKLRSASYDLAKRRNLEKVRKSLAKSTWGAQSVEHSYESLSGSLLLIEACAYKELSFEDLVERISVKTWFSAAKRLGPDSTKKLASHFIEQLRVAVLKICEVPVPFVDLAYSSINSALFPTLSFQETARGNGRFPKQQNLFDALLSNDDFDENQKRLHEKGESFLDKTKGSELGLMLQGIDIENLQCFANADPSFLRELVDIIDNSDDAQFAWLRNLAFAAANLTSIDCPNKAEMLFNRALEAIGFIVHDLGDDLTIEHHAIWASKNSELMKELWRQRLLTSTNSAILAREVLAAERFGASDFIQDLVRQLSASQSSLDQAYAYSISGYSSQGGGMIDTIKSRVKDKGITGESAIHALASLERADWAQYWVEKMWDSPTSDEFWRCLMIAKTCMDGRTPTEPKVDTRWKQYAPVFQDIRSKALKERHKQREKSLLGKEAPDRVFVTA